MAIDIVSGQTAPIDYQLIADGAAYDITGNQGVTLTGTKLKDATALTFTGAVTVTDEATGKVRFSPDASDIVASDRKYFIRFRVVRADGKVEFFPTGVPEQWNIR